MTANRMIGTFTGILATTAIVLLASSNAPPIAWIMLIVALILWPLWKFTR